MTEVKQTIKEPVKTIPRYQLTQIISPDGENVNATIHPEKEGCVVKFTYKDGRKLMNYVEKKKTEKEKTEKEEHKQKTEEEYKQFSVFIPQKTPDVLRMLTQQKGKIVPHRKNPRRFFLIWERVMVPTNFTLDGKLLQATFNTREKEDEKGPYLETIIRFYTEDGNPVEIRIRGKKRVFAHCFKTTSKEEVTPEAIKQWLLQEGQVVPHKKYEGSLFLRLGKAPVKTSFTLEVDGKTNQVYARTRVHEEKDKNGNSIFEMKMRFYTNERLVMHRNSKGKRVPFVYSYMTNNPEHVTPEAIKQWYENTPAKIVPHKKVEGKLFLLFKR